MTRLILFATVLTVCTTSTFADEPPVDAKRLGSLIGHDGEQWVMEGCAAYPVTIGTPKQSKQITARNSWTRPKKQLAQSKPAATSHNSTE